MVTVTFRLKDNPYITGDVVLGDPEGEGQSNARLLLPTIHFAQLAEWYGLVILEGEENLAEEEPLGFLGPPSAK